MLNVARFRDPVFLKAIYCLNTEDSLVINPIFEWLGLRAIENIPNILDYLLWISSKSRLKFTKS